MLMENVAEKIAEGMTAADAVHAASGELAALFAQIDDTTDRLDGASVADKFNLPPEVTEKAEEQFRETIYKIYDLAKQTGVDIFKMKNKLYRFHHKYYEVMKEDLYERMEIRTDIRFAGRN